MTDNQSEYLWIGLTTLAVCKNQRIFQQKSLSVIAPRGESSMGQFCGCKLHVAMKALGDILSTVLSNGHVADIKIVEKLVKMVKVTVYPDRRYISHCLKEELKFRLT